MCNSWQPQENASFAQMALDNTGLTACGHGHTWLTWKVTACGQGQQEIGRAFCGTTMQCNPFTQPAVVRARSGDLQLSLTIRPLFSTCSNKLRMAMTRDFIASVAVPGH